MKATRIPLSAAGALLVLLSLFLFAAACSSDGDDADPTATQPAAAEPAADPTVADGSDTTVDVSLSEFAVEPSEDSAPAGTITFNVTSDGAVFHNLRVIATDLAPDALPADDATFSVDENQVDVVASVDVLDPGEQAELTVDLEAGSYVLICNIPTHYDAGMTVAFTIE